MSTNPENLLNVALVGSEICLFQAVVKKKDDEEEKERK